MDIVKAFFSGRLVAGAVAFRGFPVRPRSAPPKSGFKPENPITACRPVERENFHPWTRENPIPDPFTGSRARHTSLHASLEHDDERAYHEDSDHGDEIRETGRGIGFVGAILVIALFWSQCTFNGEYEIRLYQRSGAGTTTLRRNNLSVSGSHRPANRVAPLTRKRTREIESSGAKQSAILSLDVDEETNSISPNEHPSRGSVGRSNFQGKAIEVARTGRNVE